MSSSSDAVTSGSAAATATLSDPRILRGSDADLAVAAVLGADLRGGTWTRSAGGTARGDAGVETALSELADAAREAARAAGYAAGWSEGRHEAQVEADGQAADAEQQRQRARAADRARVESALSALAVAGGRTDDAAATAVATIHAEAVELAIALAEAVIGQELRDGNGARSALIRALAPTRVDEQVTVRLHPDDHATLTDLDVPRPGVTLLADPSIAPGDAIAVTGSSVIDASVSAAISRVREVLA